MQNERRKSGESESFATGATILQRPGVASKEAGQTLGRGDIRRIAIPGPHPPRRCCCRAPPTGPLLWRAQSRSTGTCSRYGEDGFSKREGKGMHPGHGRQELRRWNTQRAGLPAYSPGCYMLLLSRDSIATQRAGGAHIDPPRRQPCAWPCTCTSRLPHNPWSSDPWVGVSVRHAPARRHDPHPFRFQQHDQQTHARFPAVTPSMRSVRRPPT